MPLFLMRPTAENYEIAHTREDFGPTKYPREKIWDPRKVRYHDGARPAIARDQRNLAHSGIFKSTYFEKHLRTATSENLFMKLREIKYC